MQGPTTKNSAACATLIHSQRHVALEAHVERIAQDVARVAIVGAGRARARVLDEQPAHVPPQEVHQRRMRVGLLVGVLMMNPMRDDPAGRRVLQAADAQDGEGACSSHLRTFKAAMRQQPVKAEIDAQRAEDVQSSECQATPVQLKNQGNRASSARA